MKYPDFSDRPVKEAIDNLLALASVPHLGKPKDLAAINKLSRDIQLYLSSDPRIKVANTSVANNSGKFDILLNVEFKRSVSLDSIFRYDGASSRYNGSYRYS